MACGVEGRNLEVELACLRVPVERQKSRHVAHRAGLRGNGWDWLVGLLRVERKRCGKNKYERKRRDAHELFVARHFFVKTRPTAREFWGTLPPSLFPGKIFERENLSLDQV